MIKPMRPGIAVVTVRNKAMLVLEKPWTSSKYLFMKLRRRCVENAREEPDDPEQHETPLVESPHVTHGAADDVGAFPTRVPGRFARGGANRGHEKQRTRAEDEREPPAPVGDVGERQRDDGKREAEPARQRKHHRGIGPGVVRRLFDHGDPGDGRGRDDEAALEYLRGREHRRLGATAESAHTTRNRSPR